MITLAGRGTPIYVYVCMNADFSKQVEDVREKKTVTNEHEQFSPLLHCHGIIGITPVK